MIEQLVAKTFASRNAAHLQHWKTKSFSEHMALGTFYDELIDLVDSLVEAYQGAFGLIGAVDIKQVPPANIVKHLSEEVMWLNENRHKFTKGLPALENLADSIDDLYLSTLYKLKNLS